MIFDRGEVYEHTDDEIMMITDVILNDAGFKIYYITEFGEKGSFYADDKAIIDNIKLYNQ